MLLIYIIHDGKKVDTTDTYEYNKIQYVPAMDYYSHPLKRENVTLAAPWISHKVGILSESKDSIV